MTISEFVDRLIAYKNRSITGEVFLLIQNDHQFMRDYLRLVENTGLNTVNQTIGKLVKAHYNLTNEDSRDESPESTLIASFQELK